MFRKLPLRSRLMLLSAAAVAVAVAVSALACWVITRNQLAGQLDQELRATSVPERAVDAALRDCDSSPAGGGPENGPPLFYTAQVVLPDGQRCTISSNAIDVRPRDTAVARGARDSTTHNSRIDAGRGDGETVRVYTTQVVDAAHRLLGAVSVARPVGEMEASLQRLAVLLAVVAGLGVLGAASAGLVIARTALRPVDRLTDAVEHIARTEDLTTRIPVEGKDEIARLGTSFNAMTGALASSQERQQRLIADAGHELRTPLTSLRTNVDLLLRSDETGRAIPAKDRRKLLVSLKAQMGELSGLVGDLLELSRPDRPKDGGRPEAVAVHEVVELALERARLRGPELTVTAEVEPWYTIGRPAALERAVVNLLDNAVKFSPAGGSVEVRLSGGALTVRDHGPGIPEEELPYVFDRFWRSPSARAMPGSGLGLSIVARAVQGAGGRVTLTRAPGGGTGTLARVTLPGAPSPPPEAPSGATAAGARASAGVPRGTGTGSDAGAGTGSGSRAGTGSGSRAGTGPGSRAETRAETETGAVTGAGGTAGAEPPPTEPGPPSPPSPPSPPDHPPPPPEPPADRS